MDTADAILAYGAFAIGVVMMGVGLWVAHTGRKWLTKAEYSILTALHWKQRHDRAASRRDEFHRRLQQAESRNAKLLRVNTTLAKNLERAGSRVDELVGATVSEDSRGEESEGGCRK